MKKERHDGSLAARRDIRIRGRTVGHLRGLQCRAGRMALAALPLADGAYGNIQVGRENDLRQDLTTLPVKFWSVFSYLIVHHPATSPIAIVRVFDGRRDVRAILDREAE